MLQVPVMEGEFFLQNELIKPSHLFRDAWLGYHKVIYEVIRVIHGKAVFLSQHMERLSRSCTLSGYESPNIEVLTKNLICFISQQHFAEKNIRISVCFDEWPDNAPMALAYYIPSSYPTPEQYAQGVDVCLLYQSRTRPNVKAYNPTLREDADAIIASQNVYEVLLVNPLGEITEGSKSNFFAIRGEVLITPPSKAVLEGVTRSVVIELANANGIECKEEAITDKEINSLSGAFITGTSPSVLPIKRIGDVVLPPIPKLTRRIMSLYNDRLGAERS